MYDAVEISELQSKVLIRIIDDDEDFLKSLGLLLKMTGWNVRTYLSAKDFLSSENFSIPGCIILDLRMPEITGLELQRRLAEQNKNNLPIIFLTGHGDVESAVYTLKHGAFDFLQKPINPLVLNKVVEEASRKNLASIPETNSKKEDIQKYRSLTPREREIFSLAANGKTNKEISQLLDIAVPTVKMHRANAFDKLDVHSSVEALKMFESLGLSERENDL
ncbi:response regulator transcription factor [Turicimonas muris]|uniref:response regulator transcription factor n=1 Tax=Turicimonas muris TaxID=1796652 RepID=UPI0023F4CF57|nr:response regulator [Turicimonas muris]MBS4768221.1 response regulator transcription factor [Burkholderiales bacterium]